MAEKLELPDSFPFSMRMDVRITDINYGNHAGNDAILGILHEARLQFLAEHNFSEMDCGGAGLIMLEMLVQYKAQLRHMDPLDVEVAVTPSGKKTGFFMYYQITKADDRTLAVSARSEMLFFDYERERPARMPEAFKSAVLPE